MSTTILNEPAPTTAAIAEPRATLQPVWVRVMHWINAAAMLAMILSGWQIYNAAPLFDFQFTRALTLGGWLGARLAESPALRASLNEHVEKAVHEMAPDFADFLMRHIRDTVRNWDAREMSRQIELNIGKDLQYIRINGTLVGGMVGLLLFALNRALAL